MVAYNRCLQISFIVVQLFFMALGGVLIGLGIYLEVQESSFEAAIDQGELLVGPYLLIAAGCAILLVAFIGMIGACCDAKINRFLLILYIILVLLIFAAQLVGGILGFVFRTRVFSIVTEGLSSTFDQYQGPTDTEVAITQAWDFIQRELSCCGINGTQDWLDANNTNLQGPFPTSCCDAMPNCTAVNDTFMMGCGDAVSTFVQDNLLYIAAVGIAFVVGEIVVVLMAFCLLCCTDFEKE